MELDDVGLLPLVELRRMLGAAPMTLAVLTPPYTALGCGRLRVLRVRPLGEGYHVVAGYESYERPPL